MARPKVESLEKIGRNVSLFGLVAMLIVLPFEKGVDASYQAAQLAVLVGFLIRLVGRADRRFWFAATAAFVVSMAAFTAIAAVSIRITGVEYTAGEILLRLLREVGILYFCMILLFLSQFVFRPESWQPHDRWTRVSIVLAWLLALVILASAVCSLEPFESLRYIRKHLAPYVLVYMILLETIRSWRHYKIIITTIYLVGIVVTSASVASRYLYVYGSHELQRDFLKKDIVRQEEPEPGRVEIRNQWPFRHHNRLCSYALIVTLFVWLQFFATRNWELRTLEAISVSIPFWCMILTLTRGGWIALAAAVVALVLMINWRSIWIILAVAVAVWLVSPQTVRDRMRSIISLETYLAPRGTFYLRREIWKRSFEIIRKYPFLGLGAGWQVFEDYVKANYPPLQPGLHTPHAHNNLLETAVESGLGALALFAAFAASLLVQIFRALRETKPQTKQRFIVSGFFALFIGIMVYGLSNFSLRYKVGMLIWICFALITLLPTIAKAMDGKPEPAEAVAPPPAD